MFPRIFFVIASILLFLPLISFSQTSSTLEKKMEETLRQFLKENPQLLEEKLETKLYTVHAERVPARKEPTIESPSCFFLLRGMHFTPEEIYKDSNGLSWYRIHLKGSAFWIQQSFEKGSDQTTLPEVYHGYKILIIKKDRKLFLQKGNGSSWDTIRTYPIGLGQGATKGPKRFSGDKKTPEGLYYVAGVNAVSDYGVDPESKMPLASLHISYPNPFDAWEALKQGYISFDQYNRIFSQTLRKETPDQTTSLGNWIMIHGGGGLGDWTWGCVGLENKDMKELLRYAKKGTPIEIK